MKKKTTNIALLQTQIIHMLILPPTYLQVYFTVLLLNKISVIASKLSMFRRLIYNSLLALSTNARRECLQLNLFV